MLLLCVKTPHNVSVLKIPVFATVGMSWKPGGCRMNMISGNMRVRDMFSRFNDNFDPLPIFRKTEEQNRTTSFSSSVKVYKTK